MFSSDSRWDRHLPHQEHDEERIEVGAIFKDGEMYPRWFVWQGRKYSVKEITYRWQDKRGGEVMHNFSVTDGVNVYHIFLNNRYMHWRLAKVIPVEGE